MSYVKLYDISSPNATYYYGIHPQIVPPKIPGGIDHYVGFVEDHEIDSYDYTYHKFPIKDRKAPSLEYLTKIVDFILTLKGTIYLFCKGGHGRSGTVAAALYGKISNSKSNEALSYIDKEWRKQRDMSYLRPKIIELGSPQTRVQKAIVKKYLS